MQEAEFPAHKEQGETLFYFGNLGSFRPSWLGFTSKLDLYFPQ